jgi:hypothetical protein
MNRTALIFSIPTSDSHGFRWQWRSADGKHKSGSTFAYYHDCVEDARKAGYDVPLAGTEAKNIDGTDRIGLTTHSRTAR